jgi:hypothetical protein
MEINMDVSETRHVKKARKPYWCDWCGERIEVGQPYSTWFTYGENVTARVHPECYAAMLKALQVGDEMPCRGDYRRGCWCGENKEHCQCTQDNKVLSDSGK